MLRVCMLLVFVCDLGAGSTSGRGFFCRDPDTGKLHPVNSTWPSSSFCGNYHCRIRRKNIPHTSYAPLRQLNVTDVKISNKTIMKQDIRSESNFTLNNRNEKNMTYEMKSEPDIRSDISIQDLLPLGRGRDPALRAEDKKIDIKHDSERDRYLTETEIRAISEILHTVKKSDLDAIVEIYNLAQDIYKEIDKASTNQALEEVEYTAKSIGNHKTDIVRTGIKNGVANGRISYWYEPLSGVKIRPADVMRTGEITGNDIVPVERNNIEHQGTNRNVPSTTSTRSIQMTTKAPVTVLAPVTIIPSPPPPVAIPVTVPKSRPLSPSYFNGPLTHKDFGKLPYYYPLSNFQRISSYKHQQQQRKSKMANENKSSEIISPKPQALKPFTYRPPVYNGGKYQKEIKPSVLLPYPFSNIHHYNWSYPQSVPFLSTLDIFEPRKKEKKTTIKSLRTREHTKGNAVLMNPDLENFQDLEMKATRTEDKLPLRNRMQNNNEDTKRQDWETEPLPNHILDEVRANVQDKQRLRPFPLRKKVKLERVGKLLRLDEITRVKRFDKYIQTLEEVLDLRPGKEMLSPISFRMRANLERSRKLDKLDGIKRAKRSFNEKTEVNEMPLQPEIYEVYIERTTCNADVSVPGYFRFGNQSQPYPECCPQRISQR